MWQNITTLPLLWTLNLTVNCIACSISACIILTLFMKKVSPHVASGLVNRKPWSFAKIPAYMATTFTMESTQVPQFECILLVNKLSSSVLWLAEFCTSEFAKVIVKERITLANDLLWFGNDPFFACSNLKVLCSSSSLYYIVKELPWVCTENTAWGACREINTTRGKAKCCIYLETRLARNTI